MSWDDYVGDIDPYGDDREVEDEFITYTEIVRKTEKAVLFQTKEGKIWLPKSVLIWYLDEKLVQFPSWVTIKYLKEN